MKEHLEFASRKFADPVKWGSGGTEMDLHAVHVDAAARQRDEKTLREHASVLEELAMRSDHKLYLAIAQRAWGVARRLAGESDSALSRLNRALELFQELETRWQIACTLTELGELEQSRHNNRVARDYFSRALTEFDALRAAPATTRTRRLMAESSQ